MAQVGGDGQHDAHLVARHLLQACRGDKVLLDPATRLDHQHPQSRRGAHRSSSHQLALDQLGLRLPVLQRQAKTWADKARQQRDRQHPRDSGGNRHRPAVNRRDEDEQRGHDDKASDRSSDRDVADPDHEAGIVAL
jgi:hypothetical protein